MEIAAIEAHRLYPRAIKEAWADDEYVWPSTNPSFLVRVTTEDGREGVGEMVTQNWYYGETRDQLVELIGHYGRALRGADPENFALCHRLMQATFGGGMPGGRIARAGVDLALYDLVGRARGVPVYALLGGAYRTRFEQLTNLYHKSPEDMAQGCREFVAKGFTGLKIKVGDGLLAHGWHRERLLAETALLEAALEVTPREVYIDADANQSWESAAWCVTFLRRFAGHDNLSTEQPLALHDLDGMAHVRRHAGVPVIADEMVWSPGAMLQLIRAQACDRIVLKLNRLGGFFECAKVVALAEAAAIGISVDSCPYSILGDTACCHIAAIMRTPYPVDCESHVSFLDFGEEAMFSGGITFCDGLAHLPDAPGIGVAVDWDAVARHQARYGPGGPEAR